MAVVAGETGHCPDCGADLDLTDVAEVGDLVDCPNCGAAFEVTNLAPLSLDPFEDEEK